MSITMQGTWTVKVKSKSAAFKQRFLINGSANGVDGAYDGITTSPVEVVVSGAQWTVRIQHKRSGRDKPWQDSDMRLGTPTQNSLTTDFDIFSNDSGGDSDYNDLVLTCQQPVAASNYFIYGKARSYKGFCWFNPCFPFIVIDSWTHLADAIKFKPIRELVEVMYPERLKQLARQEKTFDPQPDPPFRPILFPTDGSATTKIQQPQIKLNQQSYARREIGSAFRTEIDPRLLEIAKLRDRFHLTCTTKNQAGLLLRFVEYDRTAAELAGGAYSGEGEREVLGYAVTDEVGNYIFHFTRDLTDIADEIDDIALGGPGLPTELAPDIIVQVVDSLGSEPTVLFETAPYMNVGTFRKINLCIPEGLLNPGPAACQGNRAIQAIGNISTLSGLNSFDALGRVTSTDPSGPQISRGAWRGALHLYACFLDQTDVSHYTIRYNNGSGWSYVNESYNHIFIPQLANPYHPAHRVGTSNQVLDASNLTVPAYKNIEADANWVATHRLRKVILTSANYAPAGGAGPVTFEIRGFKEVAGKLVAVAGAYDTIRLYIDHSPLVADIDSVVMSGVAPNECALFDISTADEPLTMRFRVNQANGFLQRYYISVIRGAGTPVSVADMTPPAQDIALDYNVATHGNFFFGTLNAVAPDGDNYVEAELQPVSGSWLPAGQPFCAFAFELYAQLRTTNGFGNAGTGRVDIQLVGISQEVTP